MTAALLAAASAWCWVGPTARRRASRLWRRSGPRSTVPPDVLVMLLCPVSGFVLIGGVAGLLAGTAVAPVARIAIGRLQTRAERERDEQAAAQLPLALDLVVAALAAGRPAVGALQLAGEATPAPLGPDLLTVAHRLAVAGEVRPAFVGAPPSVAGLGRALLRAEQSGAPIAGVVAAVADDLRRDRSSARREAGRRVGVRCVAPLGLCFLPAFFLVGIVPTVIAVAGTLEL